MRERELERVRQVVEASIEAKRSFFAAHARELVEAAADVAAALGRGGKLLVFGNGGSAADAQHLASELVNRLERDRPGIAAIALTTDSSVLTSVANDVSYERVFARQVEALGRAGDVAVGISTSGNSPSVVRALETAAALGLVTVGLLGRDGGRAAKLCRHPLVVDAGSTQRIQEVHIVLGHLLAELVEEHLYPR